MLLLNCFHWLLTKAVATQQYPATAHCDLQVLALNQACHGSSCHGAPAVCSQLLSACCSSVAHHVAAVVDEADCICHVQHASCKVFIPVESDGQQQPSVAQGSGAAAAAGCWPCCHSST